MGSGAGPSPVKAKPNPYHNLEYVTTHTSVQVESLSSSEECDTLACPAPRREQQYRAWQAALKRMKRG